MRNGGERQDGAEGGSGERDAPAAGSGIGEFAAAGNRGTCQARLRLSLEGGGQHHTRRKDLRQRSFLPCAKAHSHRRRRNPGRFRHPLPCQPLTPSTLPPSSSRPATSYVGQQCSSSFTNAAASRLAHLLPSVRSDSARLHASPHHSPPPRTRSRALGHQQRHPLYVSFDGTRRR